MSMHRANIGLRTSMALALLIALATSTSAFAQDATAQVTLEELSVMGQGSSPSVSQSTPTGTIGQPPPAYPGGQVGSGTRLGVLGNQNVFNTPFNIAGYTDKLIRDQQAHSLIDVIENDPSVRATSTISDAPGSSLFIRGFPLTPRDIGFDGLFGILDYRRPPIYNVERVEVLKGPSAVINGAAPNGGVGGSINFIPKRAYDEPLTRITPFFISKEQFGTAVDIGRRYGEAHEWGVRANGVFQSGETTIDRERLQLGFGSLGVDYRGDHFRMSFDVSYQDTYYKQNRGFITVAPGIQIPRVPRLSTNLSQRSEFASDKSLLAATRLEYDVAENTTIYAAFGVGTTDESAITTFKTIQNSAGRYGVQFIRQAFDSTVYTAETGVRTRFDTGPIRHTVSLAATGYWNDVNYPVAVQFLPGGTSNLYNPVPVATPNIRDVDIGNARGSSQINRSFAFADTFSSLDDRVLLTVGGRLQQLTAKGFNSTPNTPTFGFATSSYDQSAVTPAFALVVKPTENFSVYGNYVQALISPGAAPSTSSNAGEVLPPILAEQKEVGLKYDFGTVGTSVSLFEITRPNAFQDPLTLRFSESGLQRNRGIEFNLFGEPVPGVRLLGGVAVTDGRLVKTAGGTFDGKVAPGVPDVTLNLYGEYDLPSWLLPGLTATGRVIYTTSQFYDQANQQKIPDWVRFDAGLRYTFLGSWGKPVTLRANVVNAFNTNYWASTGAGFLTPGTPRTYQLSAQFDF